MVSLQLKPRHLAFNEKGEHRLSFLTIHGRTSKQDPTRDISCLPHQIRAVTLNLLRLRPASINFAFSDPHYQVRLHAADKLAELWAEKFITNGIIFVVEDLQSRLNESPKLAFNFKDPRLNDTHIFNPEHSRLNIKLGVVMTLQKIFCERKSSELCRELAKFFIDCDFSKKLIAVSKDEKLIKSLLEDPLQYPILDRKDGEPLQPLIELGRYVFALKHLLTPELMQKSFGYTFEQKPSFDSIMGMYTGIARSLREIIQGMDNLDPSINIDLRQLSHLI